MAKVVKVFDNGSIITTLTFRDRDFILTLPPLVDGIGCRETKEKCLANQVEDAFIDDKALDVIAAIINFIDFGSDDDIEDALEMLQEWE